MGHPTLSEQIVVFIDLQGYHRKICSTLAPAEIFNFLGEYYRIVETQIGKSEGTIVKFIGDSVLIIFPATHPKNSLVVLESLKAEVDGFLAKSDYDSRLSVKAHIGMVASGKISPGHSSHFDICGLTVDQTALLPDGEWVLSEELRQKSI